MHPPATPAAVLFAYAFLSNIALAVAVRCVPRYALLAWLGAAVQLPAWVMVALFALLMVPSLRMVWWPRAAS